MALDFIDRHLTSIYGFYDDFHDDFHDGLHDDVAWLSVPESAITVRGHERQYRDAELDCV